MINDQGILKIKTSITVQCVAKKLKSILQHYPLSHVNCPGCNTMLHKTSACNDLHHCGDRNVCNFCNSSSFPWESGIPLEHWKICPRWDYESIHFPCKEGVCFTDETECVEHGEEIKQFNKTRLSSACFQLQADVGNEKYFKACDLIKLKNNL